MIMKTKKVKYLSENEVLLNTTSGSVTIPANEAKLIGMEINDALNDQLVKLLFSALYHEGPKKNQAIEIALMDLITMEDLVQMKREREEKISRKNQQLARLKTEPAIVEDE